MERRRKGDNRDVERMVAKPTPPIRNDREHRHQVRQENEPDQPVTDGGDDRHGSLGLACSIAITGMASSAATRTGTSNRRATRPLRSFTLA